ncbi:hypothetical protein FHS85_003278 [Rhodoligotrophos appendicifer]
MQTQAATDAKPGFSERQENDAARIIALAAWEEYQQADCRYRTLVRALSPNPQNLLWLASMFETAASHLARRNEKGSKWLEDRAESCRWQLSEHGFVASEA